MCLYVKLYLQTYTYLHMFYVYICPHYMSTLSTVCTQFVYICLHVYLHMWTYMTISVCTSLNVSTCMSPYHELSLTERNSPHVALSSFQSIWCPLATKMLYLALCQVHIHRRCATLCCHGRYGTSCTRQSCTCDHS